MHKGIGHPAKGHMRWFLKLSCCGASASAVHMCKGVSPTPIAAAQEALDGAGQDNGQARLVDGSADAGGAWEYGRLEVLIDSVWTVLAEGSFGDEIGRRGVQVVCRSLGFEAGAQMLAGLASPFPGPPGSVSLTNGIICNGTEASLSECVINPPDDYDRDYSEGVRPFAAALICTNPSGVYYIPISAQSIAIAGIHCRLQLQKRVCQTICKNICTNQS